MRDKVLIYADTGCADVNVLKDSLIQYFRPRHCSVELTDANEILRCNALNDKVLAFFMPGGAATPYRRKLQVLGNDKIRTYVQNGGVYYGICAGAYYACRKTIFEEDVPGLKIIDEYGLNLVNAQAIGTLHRELNIASYEKSAAAAATVKLVGINNEQYIAHYHGGPYFIPDDNTENKILAYYNLAKIKPAILWRPFGKGKVIVSGVHFENTGEAFLQTINRLQKHSGNEQKIADELLMGEKLRQKLFNKLMSFAER